MSEGGAEDRVRWGQRTRRENNGVKKSKGIECKEYIRMEGEGGRRQRGWRGGR